VRPLHIVLGGWVPRPYNIMTVAGVITSNAMGTLAEFNLKQPESAAYHEGGHVTAAVVQAMPIRASGLYVDLYGYGAANYFQRVPGNLNSTTCDERERKRTIIALFAAHSAQLRFYPGCTQAAWSNDLRTIDALCAELHPVNELGRRVTREEMRRRAETLVNKHWNIIQELARALWAKPCIEMPEKEKALGWGIGSVRNLNGEEIVRFFARYQIEVKVIDDTTPKYDPACDVPYYDSLA
jgi:hypothetical protein